MQSSSDRAPGFTQTPGLLVLRLAGAALRLLTAEISGIIGKLGFVDYTRRVF
jgi:hypothetical protein